MSLLSDAFVYLLAAVLAVPLANRLGLGSVLGYLIAGVVIGPILGIVGSETVAVQHFAEFGVVMMLFIVGLELQPAVLWRMRTQLVGLGGLQVVATTAILGGAAFAFGLPWQSALAVGMILALSSTAIVLQTLNEKGWMRGLGGQSSFSVLLTQDIAVIPMLALLPLLAVQGFLDIGGGNLPQDRGTLEALPGYAQVLVIVAVIAGIIIGGRKLSRPIFRFIAEAKLREIFTAAALLLVIAIALLMELVGLSPALGTFLAGVVLSDNEYRHELESDIAPFKGMLLGLFFLTVGAGIDFNLLFQDPLVIVGLALGLMVIKFAVLYALASAFHLRGASRWLFSLGLAQAGEFAFVLFGVAAGAGVLAAPIIHKLTLVVAISMVLTPVLFILFEKVIAPRAMRTDTREPDAIDETGTVVVAGMGRFGQVTTRLLISSGFKTVILDHDPQTIENLNKVGLRTYYGDASRPDLLHAAGLDDATIFIAALDEPEKQIEIVEHVARTYPHVRILARANDRHQVYALENAGAHIIERAFFEGGLTLGKKALIELGMHPFRAETLAKAFRRHDVGTMDALRESWNDGGIDGSYLDLMRKRGDALVSIMQTDRADKHDRSAHGWTPPPKGDADA